MLRMFVIVSVAGLLFAPTVPAATVSFDPPDVTIDVNAEPAILDFDVILLPTQENESFDSFSLVIGSDTLAIAGWEFEPVIISDIICDPACSGPVGIYESDMLIGTFIARGLVLPQRAGTVSVLVDGLVPGDYEFGIDSDRDGFSSVGASPVDAMAIVHVIPEPATVVLLALGGLFLAVRRRRRMTGGAFVLALVIAGPTSAGTVTFDPSDMTINPSAGATKAVFQLSMTAGGPDSVTRDRFEIVIASDLLGLTGFAYSEPVIQDSVELVDPIAIGILPNDMFIGAVFPSPIPVPFALGDLTVDVHDLPPGTYTVDAYTGFDAFCFVGCPPFEVQGTGTIRVIPEPATVVLLALGLGMWVWLLRSRSRQAVA